MSTPERGHKRTILSAALLVAGTCVGGGMLALPIATGISGFLPSMAVMILSWLAMTATGLLLLEVSLWFGGGAHLITMSSTILGPLGKAVSWCLYLFICYASLVAYTAGGGAQVASALTTYLDLPITKDMGCILFALIFTAVIYVGTWFVGRINTILFTAMIAAYFLLVGMGVDEVHPSLLLHRQWSSSIIAVPLLLTAFSFQTLVPSLAPYLKRRAKSLRIAIVGGTSVAFLIYLVWQWLILGIVPVEGPDGLAQALAQGNQPATDFLRIHVHGLWIASIAEYFAFFAIVTSFLGIAMGLFDFLSDGLKIPKKKGGKVLLYLLITLPSILFAVKFERAFFAAMDASGGIGDSILCGIIPVLLVWKGRYRMTHPNSYRVAGGKPLLIAVGTFFVISLGIELLSMVGVLHSFYEPYELLQIHNPTEALAP